MATNTKISLSNPSERAKLEAKRGIVRDAEGKIIRDKKWRKERVAHLDQKLADYKQRVKNIEAEKKALLSALA